MSCYKSSVKSGRKTLVSIHFTGYIIKLFCY